MSFLLELPPYLSFPIICSVTVLIAITGLWIVRKKYHHDALKEHHEVAAVIFNSFGLLYAVVVAFVVFVVWGRYDEAGKNIELEANEAIDLFYVAKVFPDSTSTQMRLALYDYTSSIVNEELKLMSKGEKSKSTSDALRRLSTIFITMDVKSLPNQPAYEECFKRFNELAQYRRLRIFDGNDSVPGVIWIVLLTGAIISITYTYFFGIRKIFPQILMISALTITITLILFLIYILDHPFSGATAITGEPMKLIMESMKRGLGIQ